MATINTYNQILTALEDIATRHLQINNYGVGDKWEIGAEELRYPILWVNPVKALMKRGNNDDYSSFEVSMDLKVMDLVDKSELNENDVQSDTLEILKDVIIEFSGNPDFVTSRLSIVGDLSFTPFTENTDEECTGWEVNINLRMPNVRSYCGLPITS